MTTDNGPGERMRDMVDYDGPTFRCKFRMYQCNPTKAAQYVKDAEGKQKTLMRNAVGVSMMGVKDDIFGPATPSANLTMTIQNDVLADALLAAFKHYYLDVKPETLEPNGSNTPAGVEVEAVFTVTGTSYPDTYP